MTQNFHFILGMGMASGSSSSPDDAQFMATAGLVGMILLGLSMITTVLAGIAGTVMLVSWFIKKIQLGSTNPQSP